jgi:hypothetical protein
VPEQADPMSGVREWGTGQAVQLRAWLVRLQERTHGKTWPEYSELQCFACHHSLTAPEQSWRQERGYPGRRPGDPAWNTSRYAVFRELAHQVDSGAADQLDAQIAQLSKLMSQLNPDREAVAMAAAGAQVIANMFVARVQAQPYDQAFALRLLDRISADAEVISAADERAAEQATMALDSLFIACAKNAQLAHSREIRAAINDLFAQLENPSAYNPNDFARGMRKVNGLLH